MYNFRTGLDTEDGGQSLRFSVSEVVDPSFCILDHFSC